MAYPGLSLRSNPGLKLANAFGVLFQISNRGITCSDLQRLSFELNQTQFSRFGSWLHFLSVHSNERMYFAEDGIEVRELSFVHLHCSFFECLFGIEFDDGPTHC